MSAARAVEAPGQPAAKPITTLKTPAGELLRQWQAEGTAAGNEGDWYDNRDRGHSDLRTDPYPQLQRLEYTPDERKRNLDWALQHQVLPRVVFGNSSTSAGPTAGGSNPRMAYSHPLGLALLYQQYAHNNLYIYPEHRDHDLGHNGRGDGYGDLYPTNTPYAIISQGSSGSDQPFMRAVPLALAAFRPEVKKKLVAADLIAPTLQAIFRQSNKHLAGPQDYLTGKAHPTVFEGGWVDERKMVELAHEIRLDDIPPLVRLEAVEEDTAIRGRDFFDAAAHEKLADTPAVLARIHRTAQQQRRMLISAAGSQDVNRRPLQFHWVLLRGDPARVALKPQGQQGERCEIVVGWHPRRPVAEGSPLESNRVDVGVFAHNGKYYSAPAFVTVFFCDDEARTYAADGRVLEIGYGAGEVDATVTNWEGVRALLAGGDDRLAARLLKKALAADEAAAVVTAVGQYAEAKAAADVAQAKSKDAAAARQKAADDLKAAEAAAQQAKAAQEKTPSDANQAAEKEAEDKAAAAREADKQADAAARDARQQADKAAKAAADVLGGKPAGLKAPIKELVEGALRATAADPAFFGKQAAEFNTLLEKAPAGTRSAIGNARRRLVKLGVLADAPNNDWQLSPLSDGSEPSSDRLTRYERSLVEQFNAEVLGRLVFDGMATFSFKRNYVDVRLASPKTWRDVYRYRPQGECVGWTRYDAERTTEFNRAGLIVIERDKLGRCVKAQAVRYPWEDQRKDPRQPPAGRLTMTPVTEQFMHYEYAGDDDWQGRPKPAAGP